MDLSNIKPPKGQVKVQRRIGRGMGSGRGKYSGRGAKGAKSISGYSKMRGFEGGQMPLDRRLPKRGFSNAPFKTVYAVINTGTLEKLEGDTFSPQSLKKSGVLKNMRDGLKVLALGDLKKKVNVTAHHFSAAAKEKIEAAGGTVTVIEVKPAGPKQEETKAPKAKK